MVLGVLPYTPQAKINFIYNHLIINDINRRAVTDIGRHFVVRTRITFIAESATAPRL